MKDERFCFLYKTLGGLGVLAVRLNRSSAAEKKEAPLSRGFIRSVSGTRIAPPTA